MRSLFAVLFVLLLAGCSASAGPAGPIVDYDSARSRWAAEGFPSYSYDFERICFCVPDAREPVTIQVRNGAVVSVVSRNTGTSMLPSTVLTWPTIDDLFEMIAEAQQNGEEVVVEYDSRGYPTVIEIGSLAADAGSRFLISNVNRLD